MTRVSTPWKFPRREFAHQDPGTAYCPECGAVHENKRWFLDEDRLAQLKEEAVEPHLCAGCQMVRDGLYDGIATLRWEGMTETQKSDLENLIRNEVEREREKNPLARIVALEIRGDEFVVTTTTEFLATRLGHAVDKAFNGKLAIDKLEREAFTRVNWTRPT